MSTISRELEIIIDLFTDTLIDNECIYRSELGHEINEETGDYDEEYERQRGDNVDVVYLLKNNLEQIQNNYKDVSITKLYDYAYALTAYDFIRYQGRDCGYYTNSDYRANKAPRLIPIYLAVDLHCRDYVISSYPTPYDWKPVKPDENVTLMSLFKGIADEAEHNIDSLTSEHALVYYDDIGKIVVDIDTTAKEIVERLMLPYAEIYTYFNDDDVVGLDKSWSLDEIITYISLLQIKIQ